MKRTILIGLLTLASPFAGRSGPGGPHAVSDAQAVRAIVGEAAGETFEGKLAIACAIRNRGNLHGVYGLNATHVWRETAATWTAAWRAWRLSAQHDITHGASYWGNCADVATGNYRRLTQTAIIGNHHFFRK